MRKLVHISDIHFGRIDYAIVEQVIVKINKLNPDLTVVSGDLTQRARSEQFREAKEFLDKLPKPQIVVPGNHDVPLYNVFNRFFSPLEKYKKYITEDLEPFYRDEEIAVIGVNTARSLTIKDGSISSEQIAEIREKMCSLGHKMLKIVVTHHPFDLPEGFDENNILDNADTAMLQIADCGADVFLSGHLHVSRVLHTANRYKLDSGRNALVIQAGTATSTRGRGEANSFNLVEFEHPHLIVKKFECDNPGAGFIQVEVQKFVQSEKGWTEVS
ncbi:MAG: metallophosphoesterase [Acidobacteriota bacterium]|jgi:3',5'-cyclic AMP phosphodiesterase CpdA|nr:metallophosphoesterase [Acidobacteriota bacterium]